MHLPTLVAALLLQLSVATATLYEPADGKIIFGAWVDSEDALAAGNIGVGGDSPAAFNRRLGKNAGVFHLSQTLPLGVSPFTQQEETANVTLVEQTNTDAILFITVYPNQTDPNSFDLYTDADITKLAYQLDSLTNPLRSSRRVMLRFAPEMNGNWFRYGQQPARFVKEYRRVVDIIRSVTNRVSFVWAPNAANLYPFGDKTTPNVERPALDTNKNGVLDYDDDPFTPYWPGTDYVDWVGISMYWKGDYSKDTPPHDNSASPVDYWEQMVQGGGSSGSNPKFPFYDMFAKKYNKPLVMPEGGAAFALTQKPSPAPLPVGVGQVTILRTFWRSYLSPEFFAKYPKAKMFINFEYLKIDEDPVDLLTKDNGIDRDYRITWDPAVLAAFKADIGALGNIVQWAVPFVPNVDPLKIGGGQTPPAAIKTEAAPAKTGSAAVSQLSFAASLACFFSFFL